jgi:hypothetical protein
MGIRALSQSVNDSTSALLAIAAVPDLLRIVTDRELDIGSVPDPTGVLRLDAFSQALFVATVWKPLLGRPARPSIRHPGRPWRAHERHLVPAA